MEARHGVWSVAIVALVSAVLAGAAEVSWAPAASADPASEYRAVVVGDGPISYWRLGETSGTTAADEVGSTSGTITGGVTLGSAGVAPSNTAMTFDGSNDYVSLGGGASLKPTGDFSMEGWFRGTSPPPDWDALYRWRSYGMALQVLGGGVIRGSFYTMDGVERTVIAPFGSLDGAWHHVVAARSGTTFSLYLDGHLVATAAVPSGAVRYGSGGAAIGRDGNRNAQHFPGGIDEVAIYGRALTAAEVAEHVTATGRILAGGPLTVAEARAGGSPSEGCPPCQHTGYPISVPGGEFWHTFTDFAFPGRGVPMSLSHSYSSTAAAADGPLGYGWVHSYGMSLSATSNVVTVREESGSELRFLATSSGATTYMPAAPRIKATLVKNLDGSWTFTRRGVAVFDFNSSGRLTSISSVVGDPSSAVTLAYDGSGKLDVVTDATGRTLDYTWTGSRITSVTDSATPARSVTFAYDGGGNLVEWTDVGGGTWSFTYDGSHRLLTMLDPNQDGSGSPVPITNVYDGSGRVVSQTDRLGRETTFDYTSIAGAVITTDPEGNETLERFVDGLRVVRTRGYGTASAATSTYEYFDDGLMASVTDGNGEVTSFEYDTAGNRTSATDPLLRETTSTFNAFGQPLTVTDAAGTTTTITYDLNGNPGTVSTPLVGASQPASSVVTFVYADVTHPGDLTSMIDPRGQTWTYGYDADGNRTSTIDPLGHETTVTFDDRGLPIATVSPRGNEPGASPTDFQTTYSYDPRGALLVLTDPLGKVTTNTYDDNGNRLTTEDPNSNLTEYVYDAEDQLTEVHRPDLSVATTEYWNDGSLKAQIDAANNATTYTYDPLGRLATITDPIANVTSFRYDHADNLIDREDPGGDCDASPAVGCTTYGYDEAGQTVAVAYSDAATPDITSVHYDDLGRRPHQRHHDLNQHLDL